MCLARLKISSKSDQVASMNLVDSAMVYVIPTMTI
jgi:hypothetical protein